MGGFIIALIVLAAAIVAASFLLAFARRWLGVSRRDRTGRPRKRNPTSIRKN